jgi:hypothetical protein
MHESVKLKLNLQWRMLEMHARFMEYLLREAIGGESRREALWTAASKAIRAYFLNPVSSCDDITYPRCWTSIYKV